MEISNIDHFVRRRQKQGEKSTKNLDGSVMLRQSKTTFKPGCNKRTSSEQQQQHLERTSFFYKIQASEEIMNQGKLSWRGMQSNVGPSESIKLWMAHQDFKNKSDGTKYSPSDINTQVVQGFYCLYLRGAKNLGSKSSDGPNPSQSNIFPEKYTQCKQQFYLHGCPRKP